MKNGKAHVAAISLDTELHELDHVLSSPEREILCIAIDLKFDDEHCEESDRN